MMCFNNQISETNDWLTMTKTILSILIINVKWERPQEAERSSGGF